MKNSIFNNLEIAFASKSNRDLSFSAFIFKLMGRPIIVKISTFAALLAVRFHLPITSLIKSTIFKQFCGGESQEDSEKVINALGQSNIKSILDYSVEGENKESHFEDTTQEILRVIALGKVNKNIPAACVKITGIGSFEILEMANSGEPLFKRNKIEFEAIKSRLNRLCMAAQENDVPIYIDAEESWIQNTIDSMVMDMMLKFNKKKAYVFNTLQLYRWDRLDLFKAWLSKTTSNKVLLGVKIVRGAYIEKENNRAKVNNYKSPIQPN